MPPPQPKGKDAIKDSSQMASDPGTASLERELMRLLEEEN
jgi:hypothetical protein